MLVHLRAIAVRAAFAFRHARHHQALYAVRVLALPQRLEQGLELFISQPFQARNQLFVFGLFRFRSPANTGNIQYTRLN